MKPQSLRSSLLLALIAALIVVSAAAAALSGPAISWDVTAGGGGTASAGNITIQDTIGQPIVGASSGGNVSLDAGFWQSLPASFNLYLPMITH